MKYCPHVDGLRAIAILFVLLFHGGVQLFPSGFVGVDIFFVISGFLITGIIQGALEKNNFSFIEFYKRRLWRLQPVFIGLMVATTLLTLVFYLPEDLLSYGKSLRKTSLFISNQYFERVTSGYFSRNTDYLPLLHTWSLSIEWQCYLILPIAIYLLDRSFTKQQMAKLIYLATLALFALSLYFSWVAPKETYYQFLSRIFEFLMGSSVALAPRPLAFNRFLLNLIAILAFISLFYIASSRGINSGFPNWHSFFLCMATAMLIALGEQDSQLLPIKFLSLKPIVFIGLLSYSLYIWHWPVLVIMRYLNFAKTSTVLFAAFSLIFIIAYLSWRFIEKPTRKLSTIKFSQTAIYLFIFPVIFFHLSAYGIKKYEGYPQRFAEVQRINTLLKKYSAAKRVDCLNTGKKSVGVCSDCLLGADNANSRKGFMIGDSFSNHNWQFMDSLAKAAKVSILAHSTASCLSLPGIGQYGWYKRDKGIYKTCREQNELYYKMIKKNHYDFVIIAEDWSAYSYGQIVYKTTDQRSLELTKKRISKAMDEALRLIIASGAKPVLIKSIALPMDNTNPHECFFNHLKQRSKYNPKRCDFRFNPQQEQWFDELFLTMKKKYSQLMIIDPRKVQCTRGVCKVAINGLPVFRDLTHITDYASYHLASSYLKRYKNPFMDENSLQNI